MTCCRLPDLAPASAGEEKKVSRRHPGVTTLAPYSTTLGGTAPFSLVKGRATPPDTSPAEAGVQLGGGP